MQLLEPVNLESNGLVWAPGNALEIRSLSDYTAVAQRLKDIKGFQRKVAEFFAPLKRKANETHRALCDEENKAMRPAQDDEAALKRALVIYDQAQERIRRAEEARLGEEARQREEARRLEEAAALEREGHATGNAELVDEAHALIAQPVEAPVVTLARTTPKVSGISSREVWKAEVTSFEQLVAAVAANPQYLGLLLPNETALRKMAGALKGAMKIDGVRVYADTQIAAGGR